MQNIAGVEFHLQLFCELTHRKPSIIHTGSQETKHRDVRRHVDQISVRAPLIEGRERLLFEGVMVRRIVAAPAPVFPAPSVRVDDHGHGVRGARDVRDMQCLGEGVGGKVVHGCIEQVAIGMPISTSTPLRKLL